MTICLGEKWAHSQERIDVRIFAARASVVWTEINAVYLFLCGGTIDISEMENISEVYANWGN